MIKFAALLSLVLLSLTATSFARKQETLQELVARAEAEKPDHQPKLYMEAADRQRKAAVEAMNAGRTDDLLADLKDVVKFSDKAHAIAIRLNKHLKDTEIRIRKISTHLKETKLDAGVDVQPAVQAAIDQLGQMIVQIGEHLLEALVRTAADDQ